MIATAAPNPSSAETAALLGNLADVSAGQIAPLLPKRQTIGAALATARTVQQAHRALRFVPDVNAMRSTYFLGR
jgi:hypothetical protein